MKAIAFLALVMGVNSLNLNRPHDRLNIFFAKGVTDDEVDQMTNEYT